MSKPTIADLNPRSDHNEVLRVVDAEVIKRLDTGASSAKAAKEVWDRVRDKTGKDWKQSHARGDV